MKETENKQQYTVIYGVFRNGSQTVHYKHLECEPSELKTVIDEKIGLNNVWFIFDGHCKETRL